MRGITDFAPSVPNSSLVPLAEVVIATLHPAGSRSSSEGPAANQDETGVRLDPAESPRPPLGTAEVEWLRVGQAVLGPLLTLAVAIGSDLLARHGVAVPNPVALLLLTVVYAALQGGLQPALISALLAVLYGAHYFSGRAGMLVYSGEGALSVLALVIAAPAIALLVARARPQPAGPADTEPPEAAARRRLLQDVALRLALAGEVEETLQSVARAAVPVLGDCCLIQLTGPDGVLRCAGSAHRTAARELAARTLAESGWPPREPGEPARGLRVLELTPERLEVLAPGAEERRLLAALGPAFLLVVPLAVGEREVGRMLLLREERGFAADEVADASELGARAALAVDHARLLREARDAEERHRLLFRDNPQPMWIFDVETLGFLEVNDAAVRAYGYTRDEFLSMTIMDLRAPEETPALFTALERSVLQRPGVALAQHRRADGSLMDVEIVSHELTLGTRQARLVMATDVTQRARTMAALHESEDLLRRAQRMDTLGRLAGGIAHDFNNLLTAIQGYADLVLRDTPPDDPRRADLDEIHRAAERGALLTRQLLTFGSRSSVEPEPVDLNATIRSMETLIQRLVGAQIRVVTVLDPDLGRVLIDPAEVEQLLITLVLSARQAMPDGGELTIETSERRIGAGPRRSLRPGRYVVLAVSDTGDVIGRDSRADPWGGQSMAYGVVRQAGGAMRVLGQPERGTTVKVYLPRLETEAEPEPARAEEPPLSRGETVLVVEDEEGVRELLRKVLTRHGYRVLEARHGKDALLEADRHSGPIHLLITDLVMPEMDGRRLVEQLVPRRPGLKVVYISGYTGDEVIRRGMSEGTFPLLQKPFSSEELMQRVRAVLDAPAAGPAPRA